MSYTDELVSKFELRFHSDPIVNEYLPALLWAHDMKYIVWFTNYKHKCIYGIFKLRKRAYTKNLLSPHPSEVKLTFRPSFDDFGYIESILKEPNGRFSGSPPNYDVYEVELD